jgi:hypothetical protein
LRSTKINRLVDFCCQVASPVTVPNLLVFFLLATFSSSSAQSKTVSVAGRAVDEKGRPLSDAIVTLYYPPCRDCIDQILPVGFSLPDAVFFVDHSAPSINGLKLFIEERIPKGYWSPVGGPSL